MNYTQCPCHDCNIIDIAYEGIEPYDCGCDMGPNPDCRSQECPKFSICDVPKNPENYS